MLRRQQCYENAPFYEAFQNYKMSEFFITLTYLIYNIGTEPFTRLINYPSLPHEIKMYRNKV